MPYEYNPLLKDGLQKVSNGGGDVDEKIAALQNAINAIQENINALKDNKITKCFSDNDLQNVEFGEIIEWQGDTNVNFENGYFYKCTSQKTIIEPGTPYYHIVKDISIEPMPPIMAGDYYVVANLPKSYIKNLLFCQYPQNGNYFGYSRSTPMPPRPIVGDVLFDYVNKEFVGVVSVSYPNSITLSNGVTINDYSAGYTLDTNVIKCVADNSSEIVIAPSVSNGNSKLPLAVVDNGVVFPIVLEPYTEWRLLTTQSTVIIPPTFIQVDTQPSNSYTLPIAAANTLGGVKVGSGLSIDANGVLSASGGGSSTPHIYRCVVITTAPNYVTALSYSAFVFNNLLFINGLFNILDTPSGNFLRVVYDDEESDIFTIKFLESFPYDANFINVDDNNLMSNIGGFARTNAGSDTLQSDNGSFPVGMASFNVVIPVAITVQS